LLVSVLRSSSVLLDDFLVWARRNRRHSWLFMDFADPRDVLRRVLVLRNRGFGARVIARIIFREHLGMGYISYSAAVKRVQRLLVDVDRFFGGGRGRGVDISSGESVHQVCRGVESGILGDRVFPRRLGRTQRLVFSLLLEKGELGLREIYLYLREHGVSYRAVFMALYRLLRRGLVMRTFYHTYRVLRSGFEDNVFVENMRSGEFIIWSKKEYGYPLPLSSALVKAAREGYLGLSQVELSIYPRNEKLEKLARRLEERGWRFTIIYRDEQNGLKIEHRFWNPDTPPAPPYYVEWFRLACQATSLAYHVSKRALEMSTA